MLSNKKISAEEIEQLRSNNFRLNSLVQELRLEINYYQGETKRLEWEKNVLKQDVNRMSTLFKGWLAELQQNSQNNRNIIDDPEYLKALVKHPAKSVSEMMQLSDDLMVISTCQAPFFIEVSDESNNICSLCRFQFLFVFSVCQQVLVVVLWMG